MLEEKNGSSDSNYEKTRTSTYGVEADEYDGSPSSRDIGSTLSPDQLAFVLVRMNYDGLYSTDDLPHGAAVLIEKIESMSEVEALEILEGAIEEHSDDVNLPVEELDLFKRLVQTSPHARSSMSEKSQPEIQQLRPTPSSSSSSSESSSEGGFGNHLFITDWSLQARLEATLIAYHSPYQEVRAVIEPFDDDIYFETFRVYLLGTIWVGAGTFINEFFSQRQPRIILTTSVVQLFLYPCGILLQYILPKWKFKIWRYVIDLNPGPWSHKEQMLATIFFSVSSTPNYAHFNIHVQRMAIFFDNKWAGYGYQTLLLLCSNFMGFGLAGLLRKFAVYPVSAVWPTVLPTLALNKALMMPEKRQNINGWTISRYRFFFLVSAISFIYFWLPGYLFVALSYFNWTTWIAPNNFNLATITGMVTGLGLNPIPTFDWNVLNHNNALTIPLYSQANQYLGTFIGFILIVGIFYSNMYWTGYVPVNLTTIYDNKGVKYPFRDVLDDNTLFDKEKYENVGPPYYTAAGLVRYGALFAVYPFLLIYESALNYKVMWKAFKGLAVALRHYRRSAYEGFNDPQTNMIRRFKEVPDYMFFIVLVISVVLAILCIKLYPTETPVWTIFFSIAINCVFLIPLTAVYAITGYTFDHNVMVELIIGYAVPGNGPALNFAKALAYNIDAQAQTYVSDQKMAHYTRLPPWSTFRVQMISVLFHSFVGLGVINFQIDSIKDYCDVLNKQKFTCPGVNRFFNATIQWGVMGPSRMFGAYPILPYCFLMGAVLALPCLLIRWYLPRKYVKYFQPTLIIAGMQVFTPFNLAYYTGGLYLSIASMWYLRSRYTSFWGKYNYVFSGAMSAGVTFAAVIIFFAVQYNPVNVNWWGNTVPYAGLDGVGVSRLKASTAEGGYFGIRKGHYP